MLVACMFMSVCESYSKYSGLDSEKRVLILCLGVWKCKCCGVTTWCVSRDMCRFQYLGSSVWMW